MATIKSYTGIEQSKKLAEILPLESSDGYWDFQIDGYKLIADELGYYKNDSEIPCWSLAALISVLPEKYTELIKEGGMYRIIIKDSFMTCLFENPVDACYEMILKLNELNLL